MWSLEMTPHLLPPLLLPPPPCVLLHSRVVTLNGTWTRCFIPVSLGFAFWPRCEVRAYGRDPWKSWGPLKLKEIDYWLGTTTAKEKEERMRKKDRTPPEDDKLSKWISCFTKNTKFDQTFCPYFLLCLYFLSYSILVSYLPYFTSFTFDLNTWNHKQWTQ